MIRHSRSLMVLSVVAAAQWGCAGAEADPRPKAQGAPTSITLDTASPKLRALTVEPVQVTHERVVAVLPAQLVLDEDHTVRVLSPVTGRVRTLDAKAGDVVAVGAPLAHVVSSDLAQAVADQAKAEASATAAARALARAEDLLAHKVIAQKELEQARNDAAQADAELRRAHQRVEQLGVGDGTSGEFVLRAPIAGVVIDRTANPGAELRPDATTPLFTISRLDALWLTAAAPQHDLAAFRPGATLSFTTDALPGRTFEATVTWISDQLDPVSRTAAVRAVVANPGHELRAQEIGSARLLTHEVQAQVLVPSAAVVTMGAEAVVFVETARGTFARRAVVVKDDDGKLATIGSGLAAGDRVVSRGSLLLAAELGRTP